MAASPGRGTVREPGATQRQDSDWDIAIVIEGDEPRHPELATSVFQRQEIPEARVRIDARALSEGDLHRRAGVLGTLPHAICRDGKVLAGEWRNPDPLQMDQETATNTRGLGVQDGTGADDARCRHGIAWLDFGKPHLGWQRRTLFQPGAQHG